MAGGKRFEFTHAHKSTTPLPCIMPPCWYLSRLTLLHHHKAPDDHEMFQVAAQVRQISISRSPKNLTGEGDVPKLKEKLPLLSIPNDGNQYRSVVSVERSDFQQHVMDSSRSFMQDLAN